MLLLLAMVSRLLDVLPLGLLLVLLVVLILVLGLLLLLSMLLFIFVLGLLLLLILAVLFLSMLLLLLSMLLFIFVLGLLLLLILTVLFLSLLLLLLSVLLFVFVLLSMLLWLCLSMLLLRALSMLLLLFLLWLAFLLCEGGENGSERKKEYCRSETSKCFHGCCLYFRVGVSAAAGWFLLTRAAGMVGSLSVAKPEPESTGLSQVARFLVPMTGRSYGSVGNPQGRDSTFVSPSSQSAPRKRCQLRMSSR